MLLLTTFDDDAALREGVAAGLLLVDGNKTAAAVRIFAEDTEYARLGVIENFKDTAAIGDAVAGVIVYQVVDANGACSNAGYVLRPTPAPFSSATGVNAYAVDPDRARALWALSEELVGESFPEP